MLDGRSGKKLGMHAIVRKTEVLPNTDTVPYISRLRTRTGTLEDNNSTGRKTAAGLERLWEKNRILT
jgi:hypothetical protein